MSVNPPDDPADRPTADVSVRIAWRDDAAAIGQIQVDTWHQRFGGVLPADLLAVLDPADLADVWLQSIARPRDARQRVLVALERNSVRGFATTVPSTDPDADPIYDAEVELEVAPSAQRQGHGSRLLHAAADTMRSDKFNRATTWINSNDDTRRSFLAAAGWAADGAHRDLDLRGDGMVQVKQVRLHTDLTAD
jgi:GNAT superfamily N-acetyltransferase